MFSSSSSSCREMSLWRFFANNMLTIHCTGVRVPSVQVWSCSACRPARQCFVPPDSG
jgi:hypothetical protein